MQCFDRVVSLQTKGCLAMTSSGINRQAIGQLRLAHTGQSRTGLPGLRPDHRARWRPDEDAGPRQHFAGVREPTRHRRGDRGMLAAARAHLRTQGEDRVSPVLLGTGRDHRRQLHAEARCRQGRFHGYWDESNVATPNFSKSTDSVL